MSSSGDPRGEDRRRLGPGELLRLDDAAAADWVVEAGNVVLFSAPLGDGAALGARRRLFERGPGDALFALPARGDGRALIAVSVAGATLVRVDRSRLAGDRAPAERWIEGWRRCLGDLDLPPAPVAAVAWLVEAHARAVAALAAAERELERTARAEARDRAESDERSHAAALSRLAAVLRPEELLLPPGSELFVAAAAVARALGVTLRPPAEWEREQREAEPIAAICRASQLRQRAVQLAPGWWQRDAGPLLGFRRDGRQPVALLPAGPGRYQLFDPRRGTTVAVDASAAATLEPEAHVLYRPLPARAVGGIELLRFALRGRAGDLLTIFGTAAAATLLGMVTPLATAVLFDHAIPDADPGLLAQIGLALLVAAAGAAAFRLAQGIAMLRVETAADVATQAAVWDRLLSLRLAFFRDFSAGDLQSRVSAIGQIRAQLSGTTLRTLFSGVVLLLNLGLLVYYSPVLASIALAVALASAIVTLASGSGILRTSRQILERSGRFHGLTVQLVHGVAKLRVAAAEERAFARWADDFAALQQLELQRRRIRDHVQLFHGALTTASAILLFAGAAALSGADAALPTGVFLAFYAAYGTFIGAVTDLGSTAVAVASVAMLRERARPILEAAPEVGAQRADPGPLAGRVELEQVVFRYGGGPLVLEGVTLRAEAGQFVALVGPSGGGKSTVLRLVLGLDRPLSGSVAYDGQELSGLDVQAVRRQIGVVLQHGRISAGSLFDNIAAGTRLALDEAWDAARRVGFAEEIEALPMGMHTVVSEGGTNLSGGQRQRLQLARALAHRPRVLLLDEATSALDNRTQEIVTRSLEQLGVTRIVVAHRLSTIQGADRIYVLAGGRVVQEGGFAELVAGDGPFARMMARQTA